MTRQNVLTESRQALLARWKVLRQLLARELSYLHNFKATDAGGDSADMAFEDASDELASRLAELDARELGQVEKVLARWEQGTYGLCEGGGEHCQHKIPLARLRALPYATHCINCERDFEKKGLARAWPTTDNWAHVHNSRPAQDDPRISVADLESAVPGNRGAAFGNR